MKPGAVRERMWGMHSLEFQCVTYSLSDVKLRQTARQAGHTDALWTNFTAGRIYGRALDRLHCRQDIRTHFGQIARQAGHMDALWTDINSITVYYAGGLQSEEDETGS